MQTDDTAEAPTYDWINKVLQIAEPKTKETKSFVSKLIQDVNRHRNIPGQRMTKRAERVIEQATQRALEAKEQRRAQRASEAENKENLNPND